MRELLDEPHGVGHQHPWPALGHEGAHRRVERREELVGDVDLAPGERAHERALARVGVADEGHAELVLTPCAPHVALPREAVELATELGDAIADAATIELHGALPGALAADAAALTVGATGLAEPRREVVEARDLDLQPRLAALRVTMKDLDDHRRAIEHLGVRRALEVARLRGSELVVHHDDAGAPGGLRAVAVGNEVLVVQERFARVRRVVEGLGGVAVAFVLRGILRVDLADLLLRAGGHDAGAAGPSRQLGQLAAAQHRRRAEVRSSLRHHAHHGVPERLHEPRELLDGRLVLLVGHPR